MVEYFEVVEFVELGRRRDLSRELWIRGGFVNPYSLRADPAGSWVLQVRLCRIKEKKEKVRRFGQEEEVDLLLG